MLFVATVCALPPCSLLYRGEGQVKYCRATLSVLSFHSFLSAVNLCNADNSDFFPFIKLAVMVHREMAQNNKIWHHSF